MKHASLFSGIGGFDLAAEWVGWENEFHCEWNGFGKRVLNYYWPKAKSYDDITKTDFTEWRGRIDVLTGGFPCQPYSVAGKRLGKEDDRHLWPHMLRAIQEIQPRYVVGENVRGLISWNGGLVFDEVQADLEAEGYVVIPCVLPACGVNAPHRRERVWFIAYRESDRDSGGLRQDKSENGSERKPEECGQDSVQPSNASESWITPDTVCEGFRESERGWGAGEKGKPNGYSAEPACGRITSDTESFRVGELRQPSSKERARCGNVLSGEQHRISSEERNATNLYIERLERGENDRGFGESGEKRNEQFTGCFRTTWQDFPTQPPICGGDDGLSRELDGITFPKWRSESIKAYGNAIVPVVAYEIFKVIDKLDRKLLRYL